MAPIVDSTAAQGDEVANNIIDGAVQDLVKATSTVMDAIFNPATVIEVVTTGSVWRGRCKMRERFAASILTQYPSANLIFPRDEPAIGAGLFALKSLAEEGEF